MKVGKMAIFGPKPWVNPLRKCRFFDYNHLLIPLEKYQFFDFKTSCFYSLERRFFVLEYRKRHFLGLYCLIKKQFGKMAISGPKPWVNPFGKMSIFLTFWTCYFNGLERRFFVLEYRKRHFPGLYCIKKKVGKMAIFGPKRCVNNFGKMLIFRLFKLVVFIA